MRLKVWLYIVFAGIFIILLSSCGPLGKRPSDDTQVAQNNSDQQQNFPFQQQNNANVPSETNLILSAEGDTQPGPAIPLNFNEFNIQSADSGNGNIENIYTEFHEGTVSEGENTWVRVWGEDGSAFIHDLVIDSDGNTYAFGSFLNIGMAITMKEGDETILPDDYSSLTKFDVNGDLIWSKKVVIGDSSGIVDIEIDNENNIYISGYYDNAGKFNFNDSIVTAEYSGEIDVFLCKVDSDCNLLWFKCWGVAYTDYISCMTLNSNGNLLAAGYASTTPDDESTRDNEGSSISSLKQGFLMEFSPSGDFLKDVRLGDPSLAGCGNIASDAGGNIYLLGYFRETVDFDPGPNIAESQSTTESDIFLAKYDNAYNFIWVRTWNGPLYDRPSALALDDSNNSYILGSGGFVFSGNSISADTGEVFLTKLNPDGEVLATVTWPNSVSAIFSKLTLDKENNVYWTGDNIYTPHDFDPGPEATTITPSEMITFIVSLDSSLNFNWVRTWGEGGGPIDCSAIAINDQGGIIVAGSFWGSHYSNGTEIYGEQDFDPGPGVVELPSNGQSSFYITSLNSQGWLD